MKQIIKLIFSTICLLPVSLLAQNGFVIQGKVSGNANGLKVYLSTPYRDMPLDSTVIKNGQFTLKGKVPAPGLYALIIDKTSLPFARKEKATRSRFYLENSNILFEGNQDSLPPYYYSEKESKSPKISGSATQELYENYLASVRPLNNERAALSQIYMDSFYYPTLKNGKLGNLEEAKENMRKQNALEEQLNQARWEFVQKNHSTVVARDLAMGLFSSRGATFPENEIDKWETVLLQSRQNSDELEELKEVLDKARRWGAGKPYIDINLTNLEGKQVKLSEFIQPGKITMLEFWASWCGPCRAEIPIIKKAYKDYHDKGYNLISISIDSKDPDWKKAVKDENMTWPQLLSIGGFESEACKTYEIIGVPHSLILDENGKIIRKDVRGASLAIFLEDYLPKT